MGRVSRWVTYAYNTVRATPMVWGAASHVDVAHFSKFSVTDARPFGFLMCEERYLYL